MQSLLSLISSIAQYKTGSQIIVGSRKGFVLSKEDNVLYVVWTHRLKNGEIKAWANNKIYEIRSR